MKIQAYIKKHWETLPQSTFNDEPLVMVIEMQNEDYGHGHHTYEGIGINQSGEVMWAYSSGCSCQGSCSTEHRKDVKIFQVNGSDFDINSINPKTFNFNNLQVEFKDY